MWLFLKFLFACGNKSGFLNIAHNAVKYRAPLQQAQLDVEQPQCR